MKYQTMSQILKKLARELKAVDVVIMYKMYNSIQ